MRHVFAGIQMCCELNSRQRKIREGNAVAFVRHAGFAVFAAALMSATAASAQTPEAFYKGKSIDLIIGYPPAGSNDVYARALARHLGKHIPGKPNVIPRNM